MPKAPRQGPLNALFAINKPTNVVSMKLLNSLQPLLASSTLFKAPQEDNGGPKKKGKARWKENRVKVGQGGTLDPLADGVLVLGLNGATKHLARFLDCTKEYRAIGLLGCSTDSYDSEGKRVHMRPTDGITAERVESVLAQFRGEFEQTPPIYSALKMDGKPLYEYARNGIPLPRPIPPRKVHVHSLTLVSFTDGSKHTYEHPKESLPETEILELERLQKMVKEGSTVVPELSTEEEVKPEIVESEGRPPTFEIRMTVSGGTYVRSIVHDIGIALGSAAHVVKLTRTRQGEFALNSELPTIVDPPDTTASNQESDAAKEEGTYGAPILETFSGGCVEWEILEAGLKDLATRNGSDDQGAKDEDGMLPWEAEILQRCKLV